jgi:hypothetical protein
MNQERNTKADPHDHNNHLPKDVLNVEQDPNAFRDPLEQQLEKQEKNNTEENISDRDTTSE